MWHPLSVNHMQTSACSATGFNMLQLTIQHRTVQPRDSGRLAPPTEPTESHGGRLSIPTHNYTIFPDPIPWQSSSLVRQFRRKLQMMGAYSVSQKSSPPPNTFCNIFTQVKYISVKFCQYVASLYLHILTSFGLFVLIFNKMASIFLGVPIVFNVFSFKFHQVKSPWLRRQ